MRFGLVCASAFSEYISGFLTAGVGVLRPWRSGVPRSTTMLMIISCSAAPIVAASTWRSAADRSLQPATTQPANHVVAQCPDAVENPLPLPTSMSPDEFHARLLAFLKNAEYAKLHWCVDKTVRDTGPYVYQEYLGTHPAVRCFYSPAVMRWLIS